MIIDQCLSLDVTTSRDSYAWNYRGLDTLIALSKILADRGFEPLIIGSYMRKNLTAELSCMWELKFEPKFFSEIYFLISGVKMIN